jgi:long-chain acyl-CoA synthetase
MSANLARLVTEAAELFGDRPAYKLDDAVLTWDAADEASARVAALLRSQGLQPGDSVGVMLPNVPYFPVVYYGVLRAGGVVVPMNVLLKAREVTFYLEDPGAKFVFAWHQFAEEARHGAGEAGARVIEVAPGDFEEQLRAAEPWRELADRGREDTAVILYTSGTTGKPKGAELTHGNLDDNARVCEARLFGLDEHDVVLGALPLFHAFGQTVCMNCAALVGACLTMIARFDPAKALEIIQRDDVTMFAGVPTMYNAMLHHPERDRYDTSCLRLCVSGGAAMPEEVMRAFEEAFACKVLEGYGLSETSPVASFNHPDRERKPGSIGTPIEGVEMKVVDDDGNDAAQGEVGEIVIRGHNVMKGYWNRPDATEEVMRDGWFHTGDMARVDEDGYFFIVDRKKDLIIRGGYNVYPREIEEVLYTHPAVAEAAVVGVPHAELGEEVGACVALKSGEEAEPQDLRAFVKERVAAYKYPRHVWLVDELPKGPTGKILKREIRVPEGIAAS